MIRYHAPYELVRATAGASGYDLQATSEHVLEPGAIVRVQTGVYLEMPLGIEAQIRPRSGLSARGIVAILGTLDADYRGMCGVLLHNVGREPHVVLERDRIAQLVFARVWLPERMSIGDGLGEPVSAWFQRVSSPDELTTTARGSNGFGSTGR